jgi:hypothetical protein
MSEAYYIVDRASMSTFIEAIGMLQAGKNPRRLAPPRPKVCCGTALNAYEDALRQKIDCDLRHSHRQLQNQQQQPQQPSYDDADNYVNAHDVFQPSMRLTKYEDENDNASPRLQADLDSATVYERS